MLNLGMCCEMYIVLEISYGICFFVFCFFDISTKKTSPTPMSTPVKKRQREHKDINAFSCLETDFNQRSVSRKKLLPCTLQSGKVSKSDLPILLKLKLRNILKELRQNFS